MLATLHQVRVVAHSSTMLEGWVKESQVALEEALFKYTSNLDQKHAHGHVGGIAFQATSVA